MAISNVGHVFFNFCLRYRLCLKAKLMSEQKKRFPVGWVIGSVLWIVVFVMLYRGYQAGAPVPDDEVTFEILPLKSDPSQSTPSVDPSQLEPIRVDDFQLVNQLGESVSKDDLLGKPWVASFIFTHCAGPCMGLTKTVMELNAQTKQADVKFVSFSVDPERDDPAQLSKYAEIFAARPERWWFLTGDKESIHRLIEDCFQLVVEEVPGNEAQLGFEFAHSTRLIHVDAKGVIAGSYKGEDPAEVAILRRVLLGQTETPKQNQVFQLKPDGNSEEKTEHDSTTDGSLLPPQTSTAPQSKAPPIIRAQNQEPVISLPGWIASLPAINAGLNSLATLLLIAGFLAIKSKNVVVHRNLMISAFLVSVIFLGFYLTYHFGRQYYLGEASQKFQGIGWIRPVYFTILITHVILAAAVPVLALITFYRAFKAQWDRHRAIARFTFPIWLYVSVTGVVIYGMLYQWPA